MRPVDSNNDVAGVFGLTRSQLRPIVESMANGPVSSFDVSIDRCPRRSSGHRAEHIILTFTYTRRSGHTGRNTAFVKRYNAPGPMEAHHYAHLTGLRAPIPRMYGALTDPDQREVIFLECLDPVTGDEASFLSDVETFRQFLAVTARFNALQLSGRYAQELRSQDWGRNLETAVSMLNSIVDHAAKGDLGGAMKLFCTRCEAKLNRLQMLAKSLVDPVADMATGLCHRDHLLENLARRRDTGELLLIDLELIEFMPRFWDVAQWLGAPDEVRLLCRPREELAQWYLEEYARWGGRPVALEQLLREIRMLWATRQLCDLWWRLKAALDRGPVGTTDEDEAGCRQRSRDELHELLGILADQVT